MISGLILAAGLARRMGRPKQEIRLRGVPMLDYAVSSFLASRAGEVVVVLRPGIKWRSPRRVKTVTNPRPSAGLSSSLRVGVGSLDPESKAVLVGLGDKPALLTSTIDRLILAHDEVHALIIVPTFRGTRGNPVLFDRALFHSLRRLRGDEGARGFIERNSASVLEVAVEDEGILLDVNVPADVRRMSRILGRLRSSERV